MIIHDCTPWIHLHQTKIHWSETVNRFGCACDKLKNSNRITFAVVKQTRTTAYCALNCLWGQKQHSAMTLPQTKAHLLLYLLHTSCYKGSPRVQSYHQKSVRWYNTYDKQFLHSHLNTICVDMCRQISRDKLQQIHFCSHCGERGLSNHIYMSHVPIYRDESCLRGDKGNNLPCLNNCRKRDFHTLSSQVVYTHARRGRGGGGPHLLGSPKPFCFRPPLW